MSLPEAIRKRLSLPVVCAPMFMVSTPALVREACLAGVIGAIPRHNARTIEEFEAWLLDIRTVLDRRREEVPDAKIGPLVVNLSSKLTAAELDANLRLCKRHGVEIVINATGNPSELTRRAHDVGLLVYADAVNMRFAEKAMSVGVDGITAIGAGGGGHSGTTSHLALVASIRKCFSGTLVMAGAISNGAAIRAAEILGADLAYLGTRFIATRESGASPQYKDLLVSQRSSDLIYTDKVAGTAANWLCASFRLAGLDPNRLPEPSGDLPAYGHLPPNGRPWIDIWSAGQGIDLINDLPPVNELVARLRDEYLAACSVPVFDCSSSVHASMGTIPNDH